MAFVLVAFMIFFGIIALFYVSIKTHSLRSDADEIKHDQARELLRRLAGSPEFRSEDCASCVDFDKLVVLKERDSYKGFWGDNIRFLQIKKVYPKTEDSECTRANYPECNTITIKNENSDFVTEEAFVALCTTGQYPRCELGKIIAGVTNE